MVDVIVGQDNQRASGKDMSETVSIKSSCLPIELNGRFRTRRNIFKGQPPSQHFSGAAERDQDGVVEGQEEKDKGFLKVILLCGYHSLYKFVSHTPNGLLVGWTFEFRWFLKM